MKPRRPQVGLVGCGRWGRHILRDLLELGCEAVVADPSPEARSVAAVRAVVRAADLPPVDGIVVATPASTHAAVLDELLQSATAPIFVEKPFTTDAGSADALARRAAGRLFVMHKWRYHPGVERLAELARTEALGPVIGLRTRRTGGGAPPADVDIVWTLAPHDLSIALEVLGALPDPRAAVVDRQGSRALGMTALLGTAPWLALEVSSRGPERIREVCLVCRDGLAVLPAADASAVEVTADAGGGEPRRDRLPFDGEAPLRRELRAFLDHLDGGPPPRSSAAEGAAEVRVIEVLRRLAGLPG